MASRLIMVPLVKMLNYDSQEPTTVMSYYLLVLSSSNMDMGIYELGYPPIVTLTLRTMYVNEM